MPTENNREVNPNFDFNLPPLYCSPLYPYVNRKNCQ